MRSKLVPVVVATVAFLSGAASPADAAQEQPAEDSLAAMSVPRLLETGEELHERLLPRDALRHFEEVVSRDSLHYEARWKAAREAVNVGMLVEGEERRKRWYRRAEEHARGAVTADPARVEGHHWLAVALGRRALEEGIRARVRLAREVRREALAAVAADSAHAGAHHVLGEWHAEVRRLSRIERWLAENILGAEAMDEASWTEARKHLERAVELEPAGLVHRIALARLYLDRDERQLARRQLEEVLARPAVEPTDPMHKQEAQELLAGLA